MATALVMIAVAGKKDQDRVRAIELAFDKIMPSKKGPLVVVNQQTNQQTHISHLSLSTETEGLTQLEKATAAKAAEKPPHVRAAESGKAVRAETRMDTAIPTTASSIPTLDPEEAREKPLIPIPRSQAPVPVPRVKY